MLIAKLSEITVAAYSAVEVTHRLVDGWHVFDSKDMPGLYIAKRKMANALKAIGPAIEKLVRLETSRVYRAVPERSYEPPVGSTQTFPRQKFNLVEQVA